MKNLLAKYGRLAVVVYLSIFALVFLFFFVSLQVGLDLESWSFFKDRLSSSGEGGNVGKASVLLLAYIATKLTQPIRIGVTVALLPLVARIFGGSSKEGETKTETEDTQTKADTQKEGVDTEIPGDSNGK